MTYDDEGRLSATERTFGRRADFGYDGRSFLAQAADPLLFADGFEEGVTGCWSSGSGGCTDPQLGLGMTQPVYDSAGALQCRLGPTTDDYVFYFAGRPVATLKVAGPTEEWTYLTTDHLGTPAIATDATSSVVWSGGFRPFGGDYQAGLPGGASENGLFLRLPGQWDDEVWGDATGEQLYYNVHRWLEAATGRFARPDPLGRRGDTHPMVYGGASPVVNFDPLGLLCQVPAPWKSCLAKVFGQDLTKIRVYDNANVVTTLTGGMYTTAPFSIFLPGSCGRFFSDPRLVLHEYFHVVDQWNTGRLNIPKYIVESGRQIIEGGDPHDDNRFEKEAEHFAKTHSESLEDCLDCGKGQ